MPPTPSLRSRLPLYSVWGLLFLAAAWLYSWTPATYPVRWTTPAGEGFYAELTDAFLHRQLHLPRVPDPKLASLADPYDPDQNAGLRVNDLSYFRGRYYLYHSAVPVVVLLAPFRLLTGHYLTDPAACVVFCLVGAWFSLWLLADIRRHAVPRASGVTFAACAAAAVFAHGYYLVLRSDGVNFVAIASAYAFLMMAVWAAGRALFTAGRTWPWLLLAGCAYGLAIASRPNYVFGAAALLIPVWSLRRRGGIRAAWGNFAAVAVPVVLTVAALLAYNYARFGQPLEFGQRYMLGGWDQRKLDFLGFKNVAINAWYYLIGPARWSAEFPFVNAPGWQAVGLLIQTPFLWLGLALGAVGLGRTESPAFATLRPLAGLLGVVLLCNLGLLMLLPSGNTQAVKTSANARYVFDFLPVAVLLAGVGVLALDQRLADRPWRARLWRIGALGFAAVSLLWAVSLDFQRLPAECYRPLAQVLNRPAHFARHWLGETYGPVQITLVLPPNKPDYYEPLVATGDPDAGDLLFMCYDSPKTVRFGLVGSAMLGPLSPPIPITYGEPHEFEVSMGSLYPAGGSPALAALSDAEVGRLKRTLRIRIDGRDVYEVPAHFFPSKPRQVRVGSTPHLLAYSRPDFSGQVIATSRRPIAPLPKAQTDGPEYGAVRLVLRFPDNKPGVTEPLLVTGVQSAGDIVYVRYENNWQIRLGLDHWGHPGSLSGWLPIDYSVNHVVEIQMGALFPPPGHVLLSRLPPDEIPRLKNRIRVVLDGEVVLDAEQPTYDSSPYDVVVGRNAIGGSSCVYGFSGEIKSTTRLPLPAAP